MRHKIYHFKLCNSVVLSIFTTKFKNIFIMPKTTPVPNLQSVTILPPTPWQPQIYFPFSMDSPNWVFI